MGDILELDNCWLSVLGDSSKRLLQNSLANADMAQVILWLQITLNSAVYPEHLAHMIPVTQ
jgi:hypothetical protein